MKYDGGLGQQSGRQSPPFGEVWIEIMPAPHWGRWRAVTSLRGGVDCNFVEPLAKTGASGHLPSGRCGLKCRRGQCPCGVWVSPPFGEVWIEIRRRWTRISMTARHLPSGRCGLKSRPARRHPDRARHLPSGRCGLKSSNGEHRRTVRGSPPFGEVWIEIMLATPPPLSRCVTSLRGGVD